MPVARFQYSKLMALFKVWVRKSHVPTPIASQYRQAPRRESRPISVKNASRDWRGCDGKPESSGCIDGTARPFTVTLIALTLGGIDVTNAPLKPLGEP